MDIKELKNYVKYNLWANTRLMETLKELTEEQLNQPIINSFPSIIKTISHNWLAEYLWLERLNGKSPKTFKYADYDGPAAERIELIIKTSQDFNEYVQRASKEELKEVLKSETTKGMLFEHSRYQMIHHCMNHSTYHRGQVVMMCKQLGLEKLGPFDYIWYLREKQSEVA